MTIAQKMRDERRRGFKEGYAEGRAEGYIESVNEVIDALNGTFEPAIIAERFKVPLEQVLEICGRNKSYDRRQSATDCLPDFRFLLLFLAGIPSVFCKTIIQLILKSNLYQLSSNKCQLEHISPVL